MKLVYQYMTIFFNFETTLNHLHPLQVENCDSNSRLVVNENDNFKFRLEKVNMTPSWCHSKHIGSMSIFTHVKQWLKTLGNFSRSKWNGNTRSVCICSIYTHTLTVRCRFTSNISQQTQDIESKFNVGPPSIVINLHPYFLFFFISIHVWYKPRKVNRNVRYYLIHYDGDPKWLDPFCPSIKWQIEYVFLRMVHRTFSKVHQK